MIMDLTENVLAMNVDVGPSIRGSLIADPYRKPNCPGFLCLRNDLSILIWAN